MLTPRPALTAFALLFGHVTSKPAFAQGAIEAVVRPIAEEALHSGPIAGLTVGISRGGRQVFANGYGMADLENQVPATADTIYRICSITKSFTAAAILQLHDQHKLELDDKIGLLLPELPEAWRQVTIRQVLTHTAGLPNYGGKLFREGTGRDLTPLEWVQSISDQPLLFEPGNGWSYSNVGYDILGLIIEKLSGASYSDYIRAHMTAPLGLEHTRVLIREPIIRHRARSYTLDPKQQFVNARSWGTYGIAPAGLGSTAGDLLKWEQALKDATVISADAKRLMEGPVRLSAGLDLDYGFGVRFGTMGSRRIVAHTGDGEGWMGAAVRIDDADVVVTVLANTEAEMPHANIIASRIAARLMGLSDPVLKDLPTDSGEQARFAGRYGNDMQLTAQDGKFFAEPGPGAPRARLLYQGDGVFIVDSARDVTLVIVRDQRGAAWVVVRTGGLFSFAAARQN